MKNPTLRNWAGGIDNVSPADAIPDGFARALINLDPMPGGHLALRAGFDLLAGCAACRGAFAIGRYLVLADGARLLSYDTDSQALAELSDSLPNGHLIACELNSQLYLSTPTAQYRTDGATLKRWDVAAPEFSVAQLVGGALSGQFKVAVTALGDDGEESGAVPVSITLDGGKLQIRSSDPRPLRVYVSPADAASLYYQGQMLGGVALIEAPSDDKARLTTAHLAPMPPAEQMVGHHSVLVGSVGRYVFLSEPMYPHLTDPMTRFFQFGSEVKALVSTDGGVFVALADRTHFISAIETAAPSQREVDKIGAYAGSGLSLPDGSAAWFGRHGLVLGGIDGSTAAPSRARHAPVMAERAVCGVIERDGSTCVLACLQGELRRNPRAMSAEDLEDVTYSVVVETGSVTRYQGFAFAGFACIDGQGYAWKTDGLYQLGAPVAEGAPIDARATMPTTDFGTNAIKRLQLAWLALDTDAQVSLQVSVDKGERLDFPALGTGGTRKVPLSRGMSGRAWSVDLELLDGTHAELSSIEIVAGATQRRIK